MLPGAGASAQGAPLARAFVTKAVYDMPLVSHSLRPKRARVADGRGLVANGS